MPASPIQLFDSVSGDLLPSYREQYVQGQLPPDLLQSVEAYLAASPIQTNIVLGRAQALLTAAQREGRAYAPPPWVQERLRYQPTTSGAGPLRRPVVRLVLGLVLLFVGASGVQWLRNEPLLPAPVVQIVTQATSSAVHATRHLVQRLTAPSVPVAAVVPALARPAARLPRAHQPAPPASMKARVAQVVVAGTPLADSVAQTAATVTPEVTAVPEVVSTAVVHGHIADDQGRPLPGATVLVQGTRQATSTNAAGDYQLTIPRNSVLLFGYGGYADQTRRYLGTDSLNVVLQPTSPGGHHRR